MDGSAQSAIVPSLPALPELESPTLHTKLNSFLQTLLNNDATVNAFVANGLGAVTSKFRGGVVTASAFPVTASLAGISTISGVVGAVSGSNTAAGAAIGIVPVFSIGTTNVFSIFALATNGSSATNSPVVYYNAFGA